MKFSIDDVRETLPIDVRRLLGQVERDARTILESPAIAEGAEQAFTALGEHGHALFGTTSLVSADSLAQSARTLEELAAAGKSSVERARRHLLAAQRIASLLHGAAGEMSAMLELEMEKQPLQAQTLALSWQERANELLAPDADLPSTGARLSAAPDTHDESLAPPSAEFAGELQEIFRQEAQECVGGVRRHLAALAADPGDLASAGQAERLLHTLKGAAATVGEPEASARAAALQTRMEQVVEGAASVTAELIAEIEAGLAGFLRTAGLQAPAGSPGQARAEIPDEAPAEIPDDARAAFAEEGAAIAGGAAQTIEALAVADPARAAALRSELGQAMHRLRGSALVVEERAAAARAATLEELCAAGATPAELQHELELLSRELPVAEPARPSSIGEEERETFAREAREIVAEASRLFRGKAEGAELSRLFHRLKGSALVVGEGRIAAEAEALEQQAQLPELPSELPARVARLEALLPAGASAGGSRREEIQLPGEPELWQAFIQECTELLENNDRRLIELEQKGAPKQILAALLNNHHTLKGVLNTMGLTPTGRLVHRLEDLLESLAASESLPDAAALVSLLMEAQAEIRHHLETAPQGWVENSPGKLEARIGRLLRKADAASASAPPSWADSSVKSGPGGSANDSSAADRKSELRSIRVATERLDALMNLAGELVVSRSRLTTRASGLRGLQLEMARSNKRLVETVDLFREEHEFARMGRAVRSGSEGFTELELDRYEDVQILARSLAELSNDFSEMHGQLAKGLSGFADDADVFGTIVSGIQSEVTRARMVPLELLFTRLRLPVRDAARREGKAVRVVVEGDEVTLDKTITDALLQPMLHLVRNAVVHGVESSEQRTLAGKPAEGVLSLRARQESGQIVLEVRDDGAGLDRAALRARGAAMGLLAADTPLDHPAIAELVFAAGLSTRASADEVAGRGVGGDVVRRTIERLNGTIRVESSAGAGTAFFITLPLTLAITKALLVRHGKRTYAVPLYFAERLIDASAEQVIDSAGARRVRQADSYVAVKSLCEVLGEAKSPAPASGPIVILRVGDHRLGLQVDGLARRRSSSRGSATCSRATRPSPASRSAAAVSWR